MQLVGMSKLQPQKCHLKLELILKLCFKLNLSSDSQSVQSLHIIVHV